MAALDCSFCNLSASKLYSAGTDHLAAARPASDTPGQDDDFFVRNLADVADLADQNARLFTILVASIASISLIVGHRRDEHHAGFGN